MADATKEDKEPKEVPETPPEPKAKVVELILRPLVDGHTVQLAAKTTGPDGVVIDHMVVSDAVVKELRLELENLQEVVIRPKVTHVGSYNEDQFAGVSTPIDSLAPETKKKYEHDAPKAGTTGAKTHAGSTHSGSSSSHR